MGKYRHLSTEPSFQPSGIQGSYLQSCQQWPGQQLLQERGPGARRNLSRNVSKRSDEQKEVERNKKRTLHVDNHECGAGRLNEDLLSLAIAGDGLGRGYRHAR
jgi:hypothetical protein